MTAAQSLKRTHTYDRGAELETHAYEFIHTTNAEKIFHMKFDVIIGNPPYQLSDGGNGASAKPIYNYFVTQAKKLNPRYLSMIIPARWYAGGKGLDSFRNEMLNDNRITHLVDYVNAKDCFSGVSLGGGVCYFLWERDSHSECEYTCIHDGKKSVRTRALNQFPVFVRYNEALSIIDKVLSKNEPSVSNHMSTRNPFGFPSSQREEKNVTNGISLFTSSGKFNVSLQSVTQGKDLIDKYKVMFSKVTSEHAGEPDQSGMFKVLSRAQLLLPNEVCTDSYLIAFSSDDKTIAENYLSYSYTKFYRFLLLQALSSINLSKDKFQFIPMQDFSKPLTDEFLYGKYNLSDEEISFIESMIRPME